VYTSCRLALGAAAYSRLRFCAPLAARRSSLAPCVSACTCTFASSSWLCRRALRAPRRIAVFGAPRSALRGSPPHHVSSKGLRPCRAAHKHTQRSISSRLCMSAVYLHPCCTPPPSSLVPHIAGERMTRLSSPPEPPCLPSQALSEAARQRTPASPPARMPGGGPPRRPRLAPSVYATLCGALLEAGLNAPQMK
jgi:hypothetical protein